MSGKPRQKATLAMETSASGASGFHPARSLPENIRAFCQVLRQHYHFVLGPGEVADALHVLEQLGLNDPARVRVGLRLVLCARQEELQPFNTAFTAFFFPITDGVAQPDQAPIQPPRSRHLSGSEAPEGRDESQAAGQKAGEQHDEEFDTPAAQRTTADDDPDARPSEQPLRSQASVQSGQAQAPGVSGTDLEAMLRAAAEFMNQLRLGQARRWHSSASGPRFDLRRTLRASLSTGGEALSPRWLARRKPRPRIVMLLDGSRSMEGYNAPILQFAYALSQRSRRVNVFTFSTELLDISGELQALTEGVLRPPQSAARQGFFLPALGQAWGGGTRIGECLQSFVREHAQQTLGTNTLVIISSDGLDIGDPEVLGQAMQVISRRSRGILWLNPLSVLPGYTPTARGISAALPYLSSLQSAATPQEFASLACGLRLGGVRPFLSKVSAT